MQLYVFVCIYGCNHVYKLLLSQEIYVESIKSHLLITEYLKGESSESRLRAGFVLHLVGTLWWGGNRSARVSGLVTMRSQSAHSAETERYTTLMGLCKR